MQDCEGPLFSCPRPTQRHMLPMIKMIIAGQIVYHCSIAANKWASNILTANAIEKKISREKCAASRPPIQVQLTTLCDRSINLSFY